jgi:hypothetical protein
MVAKVRVTAEEYAARWGQGLTQSIERMRTGIENVTVAPGRSAAAKADKWHAAISRADTKAKWAARVGAVPLEVWQSAMINKGLNRISSGVEEANGKMAEYGTKLIAHQNALLTELERMPDITLEDSINRATHWIRGMAKLTV